MSAILSDMNEQLMCAELAAFHILSVHFKFPICITCKLLISHVIFMRVCVCVCVYRCVHVCACIGACMCVCVYGCTDIDAVTLQICQWRVYEFVHRFVLGTACVNPMWL